MSVADLVLQSGFPTAFVLLFIFTAVLAAVVFVGVLIWTEREHHQNQDNVPRQASWLRNVIGWILVLALLATLLIIAILIVEELVTEAQSIRQISSDIKSAKTQEKGNNITLPREPRE